VTVVPGPDPRPGRGMFAWSTKDQTGGASRTIHAGKAVIGGRGGDQKTPVAQRCTDAWIICRMCFPFFDHSCGSVVSMDVTEIVIESLDFENNDKY